MHKSQKVVLKVEGVSKQFAERKFEALNHISFELGGGSILAIVGKSGSGKSTLLNIIAGHISPDQGNVILKGEKMPEPSEMLLKGYENIALQKQDFQLPPRHTVRQNIKYPIRRYNSEFQQDRVSALIDLLELTGLEDKMTYTLSGGQQQRVALARAIAAAPDVLLLDEPFNQLDFSTKLTLKTSLQRLVNKTGLTIIIVSHDPLDVLGMADETIVLKDGEMVEQGYTHELYSRPKEVYTANLFGLINVLSEDQIRERWNIHLTQGHFSIRPEYVSVGDAGYNMKVAEVQWLGHYSLAKLTDDTGLSLYWIVPNVTALPVLGSEVFVTLDANHLNSINY